MFLLLAFLRQARESKSNRQSCFSLSWILHDARLASRLRRPVGHFRAELLGVLRHQPLPAVELHGLCASEAADGASAQKPIQNIETNVPAAAPHATKRR